MKLFKLTLFILLINCLNIYSNSVHIKTIKLLSFENKDTIVVLKNNLDNYYNYKFEISNSKNKICNDSIIIYITFKVNKDSTIIKSVDSMLIEKDLNKRNNKINFIYGLIIFIIIIVILNKL